MWRESLRCGRWSSSLGQYVAEAVGVWEGLCLRAVPAARQAVGRLGEAAGEATEVLGAG